MTRKSKIFRLFALLLSVILFLGAAPVNTMAEGENENEAGFELLSGDPSAISEEFVSENVLLNVSGTTVDMYKSNGSIESSATGFKANGALDISTDGDTSVNKPVSYTHLDVYKRQCRGCVLATGKSRKKIRRSISH